MSISITRPANLRAELNWETMPLTMRRLPIEERGYPVPWFVAWDNGKPEFRAMDATKWIAAVAESLCWVCGGHCGVRKTFVIGPMCGLNRNTAEPGGHWDCGEWSAQNCPFLSRPKMVRREDDEINNDNLIERSPGMAIARNPGVIACWTTKRWRTYPDGKGGRLIQLGDPERLTFWREGRTATPTEVLESIESGYPFLEKVAREHGELQALEHARHRYVVLLQEWGIV